MATPTANTKHVDIERRAPKGRVGRPLRSARRPRLAAGANNARRGLARMGERDIAALLRQIDGDALDEFGVRDSEEILDADFDGQVGLSDLLDTLGTYVRHRSSMYITQDDGSEPF